MTTLVNAPAVGFDLARLSGGSSAARVLDLALGLTGGDLASLVGDHRPLLVAPATARPDRAGAHVASALRHAADLVGEDRATEALTLLHGVPVLGPDAVVSLVRGDVLGWVRRLPLDELATGLRAVDLVLESLIACWAGEVDAPVVRHVLTQPRRSPASAAPPSPLPGDGPLAALRSLDAAGRRRVLAAASPRPTGWARAMHEATWAAHVTGRLRPAARSQMRAVTAVREANFSTHDLATGLWNSVSGAVMAASVVDVLDSEVAAVLSAPLAPLR